MKPFKKLCLSVFVLSVSAFAILPVQSSAAMYLKNNTRNFELLFVHLRDDGTYYSYPLGPGDSTNNLYSDYIRFDVTACPFKRGITNEQCLHSPNAVTCRGDNLGHFVVSDNVCNSGNCPPLKITQCD